MLTIKQIEIVVQRQFQVNRDFGQDGERSEGLPIN